MGLPDRVGEDRADAIVPILLPIWLTLTESQLSSPMLKKCSRAAEGVVLAVGKEGDDDDVVTGRTTPSILANSPPIFVHGVGIADTDGRAYCGGRGAGIVCSFSNTTTSSASTSPPTTIA